MYTRTVIPQIEARIEERLLHEYMKQIPNTLERQELFNAYVMRRHRLSKQPEEDMLGDGSKRKSKTKKMKQKDISRTIASVDGTGIRFQNFSDIGRYTVFPA